MSKRKVHRAASRGPVPLCDASIGSHGNGRNGTVVTDEQFVWLPAEVQCKRCGPPTFVTMVLNGVRQTVNTYSSDWFQCASAEMQITVESIVLAIHRIGQDEHEHRCWFELCGDNARRYCTCARHCLLDVAAPWLPRDWWPFMTHSGKMFGPVEKLGNEKLDGDIAYDVIRERHGQAIADAAVERSASKKRIKEALGFVGVKGQVAELERKVLDEARARGGSKRDTKTVIEEFEPRQLLKAVP